MTIIYSEAKYILPRWMKMFWGGLLAAWSAIHLLTWWTIAIYQLILLSLLLIESNYSIMILLFLSSYTFPGKHPSISLAKRPNLAVSLLLATHWVSNDTHFCYLQVYWLNNLFSLLAGKLFKMHKQFQLAISIVKNIVRNGS